MTYANDTEHLITMTKAMVLWIINDYEDEDLRGQCRDIIENLDKLQDMTKGQEVK